MGPRSCRQLPERSATRKWMMTRLRARAIVLCALSMAIAALPARATADVASFATARVARLAPHLPHGSVALGRLADPQPLTFEVVLHPPHVDALQTFLEAQRVPSSPLFGHYLDPGQFVSQFGPTADQVGAVTAWLRGVGLDDITVDDFAVKVRTDAGAVARALGVSLERYRTPDHRTSFSAAQAPLVPSSLAGGIASILGLDATAAAQPKRDAAPDSPPAAVAHAAPHADGLTPCSGATTAAGSSF